MTETEHRPQARIAILAALDTKAEEAALVRDALARQGLGSLVIDVGILGQPGAPADIGRAAVAEAGNGSLATLIERRHSGQALAIMGAGAKAILARLVAAGEVAGALAVGGTRGAVIATDAMRDLPLGLPKIVVMPSLTGNVRQLVGSSDIVIVPAIADLLGLNRITRAVLDRAVAMLAAWLGSQTAPAEAQPTVALTSFGATTPCVTEVRRLLLLQGLEVVVFPANGIGGAAMENLVAQGQVSGVIDITTHELVDTMLGGMCATSHPRLAGPGLARVPRVVCPGATDFANFLAGSVPPRFADRNLYEHSSAITLMRLTPEECHTVGTTIGERLADSGGRTAVVAPMQGFSEYDRPDGPFWQPSADRACVEAIAARVAGRDVSVIRDENHINAPAFAARLVGEYLQLTDRLAANRI